jgi:hypothetical protein
MMLARSVIAFFVIAHLGAVQGRELRLENQPTGSMSEDNKQSQFNYQMFCQGCHSPEGFGYKSVPALKNSMHRFMATQQGRSYLVQVPGSAYSPLNDKDLTQLLNWMLIEFSGEQQRKNNPPSWRLYTEQEVSEYRKTPLFETVEYRKSVLQNLPHN